VRREAFDAIGGFDPNQWMYAEDLDLAWRLRREGWVTRYEPAAEVHHAVSAATARAWGDERNRRSMAATYAWLARRRGLTAARAVAAVNIAGAAARVAWHGAVARLTSSSRHAQECERWRWHLGLHRLGLRPKEEAR
jgi:N-acetylglucosaminyl-diphospho-decaprenol L-rhamnosyltransferase